MSTEAKPIIDTDDRKRLLAEALTLTIERHERRAKQLRLAAMNCGIEGRAINLQLAREEDKLRHKAEALKEEFL